MNLTKINIEPICRVILWIFLLLFTSLILLFPVHLQFEYHPIESLFIFDNYLWLFTVVYTIWFAILILLLLTHANEWERVLLVGIFTIVYLGFWIIITPYGGYVDGLVNMGHVRYLTQTGTINFDHPMLAYFQFPGIHLTSFSLSAISGFDILLTRTVFLLISYPLFAGLLYIVFARSLKNQQLASFSVLLVLHGCLVFSRTELHAQITAILLFVILIFGLFMKSTGKVTPFNKLLIVCFPALTITYLPIPAFFIFTLGGIFIIQGLNGKRIVSWMSVTFCVIVFFTWESFGATRFFNNMVSYLRDFVSGLSDPLDRISPIIGIATNKLGESVPLWASFTRLFWIIFVFLFGIVLGIINLFRFRKLAENDTIETGALIGILIFSSICVFAFPGGTQTHRLLTYGPLFTIPIIMVRLINFKFVRLTKSKLINTFIFKPWNWFGHHAIATISIAFMMLSLPTFLVNRADINTMSIYKYELSAGEFIENLYNDDNNVRFVTDVQTVYEYSYYIPNSKLNNPLQSWELADEEEVWLVFNSALYQFESSKEGAIFIFTERFDQVYRTVKLIKPTEPKWLEFTEILSRRDLIYNNSHTRLFYNHVFQ